MKYSMASLDSSIDRLLPNIAKAKTMGVNFNRIDLCKMVAVQQFINEFNDVPKTYNDRIALYVVAEFLVDIETLGFITFGERDANLEFTR